MRKVLIAALLLAVPAPTFANVINARHKPNDNGWGSQEWCATPGNGQLIRAIIYSAPCADEF